MEIKIARRKIGDGHKVFIIAELSANHARKFAIAEKTVRAIKAAGADAVKLQTYTPDTMTIDAEKKYFKIAQGTIWDGRTLYNLYQEAHTPWKWQPKLKKLADELGLICFSSPFDKSSVDFLEKMNMPAYKVASFEITDIPLIEYTASKGKPVIFSTGVAVMSEIKEAIKACRRMGNNQIAVLKCTSAYPAPYEEMNLRTITDMKERLNLPIGLSDHSLGNTVPVAAVALGASIVEKHFILDKKLGGPDAAFSLEPDSFKKMVECIRDTEKSLGKVTYSLSKKIERNRVFTRSLFAVKDIMEGDILTEENIKSIRPGYGLPPKYLKNILGKRAVRDIQRGEPLSWGILKKGHSCLQKTK